MRTKEEKKKLVAVTRKLKTGRILVVGDLMLDQFIYGSVDRISPEAPVPVVHVDKDHYRLGGCANVAANLKAFGADVELYGVIGKDEGGRKLLEICREHGIGTKGLVVTAQRSTTIKTRIIASHQQVVRYDREERQPLSKRLSDRLLAPLDAHLAPGSAVIVADYGKGVVGKALLDRLRLYRKRMGIIVAVDPKVGNYRHYKGMTLMTPNHHEAGEMIGRKIPNESDAVVSAGKKLISRLSLDSLLITRGEEGMTLFSESEGHKHIPTRAQQVFDVTGAGDTVIATLTLALVSGASLFEAADVANHAAGLVVGKLGTATTTIKELVEDIWRGRS